MNVSRFGRLAILTVLIATAACITVNVNFPESAVQKAADDFVKDLYKDPKSVAANGDAKEAARDAAAVKKAVKKNKKKVEPAAEKPAGSTQWRFEFGIPQAYAAEPALEMHTPKIDALRPKMAAHGEALKKWKLAGAICETNDGLLDIADASKAGASIGEVNDLIEKQNDLRKELFKEVNRANNLNANDNQAKTRKIFAAKFQEEYPPACK